MKILNLYAGIGGNRKLWGDEHEIVAIENNPEIARIYQDFFPNDKVIITHAHEFLLQHFKEFDFIWSFPPCPSHSRIRFVGCYKGGRNQEPHEPIFPDMKLYEEIIFLKHYFKGKWVVENVISFYEPLIKPFKYRGHFYWANFIIDNSNKERNRKHNKGNIALSKLKGFELKKLKNVDKRKILRNCVEPRAGLHVLNCAFKNKQTLLVQTKTKLKGGNQENGNRNEKS